MHSHNHFVPRFYLKQWESPGDKIWAYRLLVSDNRVPKWSPKSVRGIAYHEHLYTTVAGGNATDDIERWLDAEFESPAAYPIYKATSEMKLGPQDWDAIARFAVAQHVRTPARLFENLQRWRAILPALMETTLEDVRRRIDEGNANDESVPFQNASLTRAPFRISTAIEPGAAVGTIRVDAVVGRRLWLFGIQHLLTKTLAGLSGHRWTILQSPIDFEWITSDDPVLLLNYVRSGSYDFGGGWGRKGTEIYLPLSPKHLLYTQVGAKPPPRGTVLQRTVAMQVQRFMAEHAHQMIFARAPDALIPLMRPRSVDSEATKRERAKWLRWHADQTEAELALD